MPFNKDTDPIAFTVDRLHLKKSAMGNRAIEWMTDLIHNEPYMITLAVDAHSRQQASIDWNYTILPNMRPGDTQEMLGNGHMVYGPKNPGEFVTIGVAVMELDRDVRDLGEAIETAARSAAAELATKAVLTAAPGYGAVAAAVRELLVLIGSLMAKDRDDFLYHTFGTFLRDMPVPYDINRSIQRGNEFVDLGMKMIPLTEHNGEGKPTHQLDLD